MTNNNILRFIDNKGNPYIFTSRGLVLVNECNNNSESPEQFFKENESYLKFNDEYFKKAEENVLQNKRLTNLTIFLTENCNLRCSYCYEYETKNIQDTSLDFASFKKHLSYFINNYVIKDRLNITFFGGEPLLKYDLIKQIIAYCKKIELGNNYKITFSITTNGTLLDDEKIEFFKKNDLHITCSYEGLKTLHDKHRKFSTGQGSFDLIKKKLNQYSKDMPILARSTFSSFNISFKDWLTSLTSIGIYNMTFAFAFTKKTHYSEETYQNVINFFDELSNTLIAEIEVDNFINVVCITDIIKKIHSGVENPNVFACGAGISSFTILSNGDIYFCHRFSNVEDFLIGNTMDGIDDQCRKTILNSSLTKNKKVDTTNCVDCWAQLFCGGGCLNTTYLENEELNVPNKLDCHITKEKVKACLKIYTSLTENQKDKYFT